MKRREFLKTAAGSVFLLSSPGQLTTNEIEYKDIISWLKAFQERSKKVNINLAYSVVYEANEGLDGDLTPSTFKTYFCPHISEKFDDILIKVYYSKIGNGKKMKIFKPVEVRFRSADYGLWLMLPKEFSDYEPEKSGFPYVREEISKGKSLIQRSLSGLPPKDRKKEPLREKIRFQADKYQDRHIDIDLLNIRIGERAYTNRVVPYDSITLNLIKKIPIQI